MVGSRTSGVASGVTACRYYEHADREVGTLLKLENWVEECDRWVDRASAFER